MATTPPDRFYPSSLPHPRQTSAKHRPRLSVWEFSQLERIPAGSTCHSRCLPLDAPCQGNLHRDACFKGQSFKSAVPACLSPGCTCPLTQGVSACSVTIAMTAFIPLCLSFSHLGCRVSCDNSGALCKWLWPEGSSCFNKKHFSTFILCI